MSEPRIPVKRRQQVIHRASECCEYCRNQARFSSDSFSIEHIIPRSKSGTDAFSNLALSCQGCNNRKYTAIEAIDPVTGMTVPLFHPRRDIWSNHFAWNEAYTLVIGLTPTGRATVDFLQINRDGLVSLRRVLRAVNEHPPYQ